MRDLCVRTFFSVQENIIQKIKEIHSHTHMGWRAARRALRVFLFPQPKKRVKKVYRHLQCVSI